MAIKAATLDYTSVHVDERGYTMLSSRVYSFASADTGDFTEPINLDGAKSVWVSTVAVENAEFWTINYEEQKAVLGITTKWSKLSPSKATANSAYGFGVVNPSTEGAGFIGGNNIPPYLTVKLTGATSTIITMHITY
jgi:hypothetical protein